nr:MAG TPA: hypothetical protein [Caudoviricetes sp.]
MTQEEKDVENLRSDYRGSNTDSCWDTAKYHKVRKYAKVLKESMKRIKGKIKYLKKKGWQRSTRHTKQGSRVRHAKRQGIKGYRYKGGR